VTTHAAPADLISAIHAVVQGQTFVDPTVTGPLLHELLGARMPHRRTSLGQTRSLLSPREREVLIRLAQGYTSRQIAAQIHVSIKSVETYRARIAQKLELHSRADLTRYAHASGLLTSEMVMSQHHEISRE
jgi:DNA-binding NarL/FixJ family response regulator